MPPPFTSFEATGFPSEILREVSNYCLSFFIFYFLCLYAIMVARSSCKFANTV